MLLNINMRTRLCVEKDGKLEHKDKKKCSYRVFVDIKRIRRRALYLVGKSYRETSFLFLSMSVKFRFYMSSKENV